MTKEQFLSGVQFTIGPAKHVGDSTYNYDRGHISKQIRSALDGRIVVDDYECNIEKVGRVGFTGIAFVLGKRVVVKHRFADLVEYKQDEA